VLQAYQILDGGGSLNVIKAVVNEKRFLQGRLIKL
jgi:hypothetical protein